jgi:protein-L-isoaspartate(D-aspartate) O-methyltransferase
MAREADREALVERLVDREGLSERVAAAMRAVPRHEFVPDDRRQSAYEDRPLPIGNGQTISAPHMVAIMVEELDLGGGERVLEVGTGRGYHAAVTAAAVGDGSVYSVEYDPALAERARETLAELGYDVAVRRGDGREGWAQHAPYDAAYLTCAAPDFPERVVEQVREGGRLLAPLGSAATQRLVLARKSGGDLDREHRGSVRFVRIRGDGQSRD